ncbi:hypothetical protein GIB67_013956 [Kingdonia uniflora]|uniref:Uncharacterized protein n=1 Tax=Kingdonia uniflora TaxID=39325 RepID=A0A7J7LDF5_9MAGN|nr:hypothetical protein GIB67_013956 [Kingdonia uniflora]
MAGVDEGKMKVSGEEARTNFSKTLETGSSAQPNPVKLSRITLKYSKKWMLKALPASGTTGSGEVAKDKRRRVKPSGESGEKVARLVKGIWIGIVEEKSELNMANIELKKELAQSRTDPLKEVRQLKAFHAVAIGQLQVETKANLDKMVEERDRLGRHLMLKGYSEEEVDAIKVDTYVEEEVEAVGIIGGLDGASHQTVLDNQGDDVELPEGGSKKAVREMCLRINDLESGLSRERDTSKALLSAQPELQVEEKDAMINKRLKELAEVTKCAEKLQSRVDALVMKDDELRVARENLSVSEAAAEHLQISLPAKDMEFREIQRRCNDLNERVARLKTKLAQAIARAKKVEARKRSGGSRTEGHDQKGNANLRECQHMLDTALIREKVMEGEIKVKESLVKRKEELLKDIPAREELNTKICRLCARVVDLKTMNLAESAKYIKKLEEKYKGCICGAKIDRGNCLGVMETQLGPQTAELIELGTATVICELNVRPLDVGGSTADSPSAEMKLL